MLQQVDWPYNREYRSGTEREPLEFYLSALANSNRLDLLLGYFSFSAINVLSLGFAQFLSNGGKMRVIANNILSKKDKETLIVAQESSLEDDLIDLEDVKNLKYVLDDYGKHFFECMAWLIANERIEFVIVKPKGKKGISHFKSGVFYDDETKVSFKASCNFTAYGMLENFEEVAAFLKWENSRSSKMIESQERYFEDIFSGNSEAVDYVPIEEIEVAIRDEFGNKGLQELLTEEGELFRLKSRSEGNQRLIKLVQNIEEDLNEIISTPRFPFPLGPRAYQNEAYQNWQKNGNKGIFAMATGTGKTITSLNCLLNEYEKSSDHVYHALILVPTITLVNQWEEEAKNFNFQEVIKVSSKNKWEAPLATLLSTAKRIPTSFVIISTYASFTKERFNRYMELMPSDLVFISDEAHNVGSRTVLDSLKSVKTEKRIGLSATPKRIYDPEGSAAMEGFFGDSEPYTYSFSMERAIEERILCRYDYHPHIVSLQPNELEEYIEISKKLARFFNPNSGELDANDIAQKLLLKRKRIIHKAANKLQLTTEILKDRFKKEGNLLYTFIYVPEGITKEVSEEDSDDETDDDNIRLINQYTREIGRIDDSILVNKFISGMSDRDEILDQFKEGKIQVIASMKCLDEGVDIPRAEHAIFCSSTGNPRQFIQRRGRILRTHKDKHKAVIHDLVVVPDLSVSEATSDTFRTERSLVKKELERVMYFASLSENPYETETLFSEVCDHYDLNIYTIHNELNNS